MSQIEFDEFQEEYYEEENNPKMIDWVIKYSGGLITNKKQERKQ